MMKQEFEALVGQQVSAEDYKDIEFVYIYHPSIEHVDGKEQIASLYKIGGMRIIRDMIPSAQKMRTMTDEHMRLLKEADALYEEMQKFKAG